MWGLRFSGISPVPSEGIRSEHEEPGGQLDRLKVLIFMEIASSFPLTLISIRELSENKSLNY